MKRRSKVSGDRIKARGRKTPGPQRPHGLKAAPRSKPSPTKETNVARLARELSDERRQRTATSEVLRLLSGSHGDLNHLFDTILANATNLCRANFGTLSLYESDAFRIVAMHNVPPGLAELRRREPLVRAGPLLRELEDLGAKNLKGIAGPVRAWTALRPASVESRFEAFHATDLTELVGREEELEILLRRWSKAKGGEGQVVLLSGEPGIGKSR